MAKRNSSNQDYTNNADGWDLTGGTTGRKLTVTGANITLTGSGTNVYTFPASTSTLASLTLSETLTNKTITSPVISSAVSNGAGSIERDANVFYSTPLSGATGVSPSMMYSIVASGDFSLSTSSGVQSAFASTGDVWTLAGSTTYLIEGQYYITKTTNNVTTAMAFALGGGASVTSILYSVVGQNTAVDTTTNTAQQMTFVDTVSSTVVNGTTTGNNYFRFSGIIRMNAGGTVTPQVNFSGTVTAPVMKANSFITFTPTGTNTNNILGNVG